MKNGIIYFSLISFILRFYILNSLNTKSQNILENITARPFLHDSVKKLKNIENYCVIELTLKSGPDDLHLIFSKYPIEVIYPALKYGLWRNPIRMPSHLYRENLLPQYLLRKLSNHKNSQTQNKLKQTQNQIVSRPSRHTGFADEKYWFPISGKKITRLLH